MSGCDIPDCKHSPIGRYLNGHYCASHTPAAAGGRTEPPAQDASWIGRSQQTMAGAKGGTDVNKERPGGYMSRQRAQRIAQTRDAIRGDHD